MIDSQLENPVQRQRLLPSCLAFAILHSVISVLAKVPYALIVGSAVAPTLLAILILRTRDSVRHHCRLHPVDARICRVSGPLATVLLLVLISTMILFVAEDGPIKYAWLGTDTGIMLIQYVAELGVIFSAACLYCPRTLRPVPPIAAWKGLCAPLLFIYSCYVIVCTIGVFAREFDRDVK